MMSNVISLIERFGRVKFSRRLAELEDQEAEHEFYAWLLNQKCCLCGGEPELLHWGPDKEHYCAKCARAKGLLNE